MTVLRRSSEYYQNSIPERTSRGLDRFLILTVGIQIDSKDNNRARPQISTKSPCQGFRRIR